MNTFKITIRHKEVELDEDNQIVDSYWPVVAEYIEPLKPSPKIDAELRFNPKKIREKHSPKQYGIALGKALFQPREIADSLSQAYGSSSNGLRILLSVEAKDLRTLRWERLCVSTDARWNADVPQQWKFLALDQKTPFSWFVSTGKTSKWIGQIQQKDLRVLLLVASPNDPEGIYGLAPFDVRETIQSIQQALGSNIRCDVLTNEDGVECRIGSPSLKALSQELSRYTALHLVCHGELLENGKTLLYLADENNEPQPIISDDLIAKLNPLAPLPYLVFLSSCETAQRDDETGLGGLAQQLVSDLAIPNVIGMTKPIAIRAAAELSEQFYKRFREHGEVDLALAQAKAGLDDENSSESIVIPALFSCLHEVRQPLFVDVGVQSNAPTPKQQREAVCQFLEQVQKEFSTTRVFHKRNLEIYLEKQYVPIQVTTEPRRRGIETLEGYKETEEELKRAYALKGSKAEAEETLKQQQKDWQEVRQEHQRLMVLADPGMGKSTLLQMEVGRITEEALKLLKSDQSDEAVLAELVLPVFLRLSTLANCPEKYLIDRILASIACSEEIAPILLPLVKAKLKAGQSVLLLDALDEVPRPQNPQDESKRLVLKEKLKGFVVQCPCRIICTSRIVGYDGGFLEGAKEVEIVPFGDQQIEEYVQVWFKNTAGHLVNQSASATELLRELRSKPQVRGLTQNPLLLSMICSLYQEQGITLPARRSQVYEQAISQMLKAWSKNRQEQTPGRIVAKQRCLEILAYRFSCRGQEVFTFDELFDEVERYLAGNNVTTVFKNTTSDALIAELSEQDGILQKLSTQGDNYIFLHRTFQEYLTAAYLARAENGVELAMEHCWNYDWHETLSLVPAVMQMEKKKPKVLIQAILNQPEGDDIFNTQMLLAARCAAECDQPEHLLPESEVHQLVQFWQTYPTAQFITSVLVRLGQSDPRVVRQLSTAAAGQNRDSENNAILALGRIGNDSAVNALIAAFKDENNGTRKDAAMALGRIGNDSAVNTLITALKNENSNVRENAVEALGQIHNNKVVDALTTTLDDEDSTVKWRVTHALGKIGNDRAVNALITALNHKDWGVRRAIVETLSHVYNDRVVNALITALKDKNSNVRECASSALKLFNYISGDGTADALIAALDDEDSTVQESVICALEKISNNKEIIKKISNDKSINALASALKHEDAFVRIRAAEVLGQIRSDSAVEALIAAFKDENNKSRITAVEVLGQIRSDSAVEALITALDDKESIVRQIAARGLGQIGGAVAVAALTRALRHEDSDVRRGAAEGLGSIGEAEAVESLTQALNTNDSGVQIEAILALEKIGNADAVKVLTNTLNDRDSTIRSKAAESLGKIGVVEAEVVPALTRLLDDEFDSVRRTATEALFGIGAVNTTKLLTNALHDKSKDVRLYAVRKLGEIGGVDAMVALRNVLDNEEHHSYIRGRTAMSLAKIGAVESEVVAALIDDIDRFSLAPPVEAIETLAKIGGANAIAALENALINGSYGQLHDISADALGQIGNVEAVMALTKALRLKPDGFGRDRKVLKVLMQMDNSDILISITQDPVIDIYRSDIFLLLRKLAIRHHKDGAFNDTGDNLIPLYPKWVRYAPAAQPETSTN